MPGSFCTNHFNGGDCPYGDKCFYNHNESEYMKLHAIKKCPKIGCKFFCKKSSLQCRKCSYGTGSKKSCSMYFGYARTCPYGNQCSFSHDETVFMLEHNLKWCSECPRFCKIYKQRCGQCSVISDTKSSPKYDLNYMKKHDIKKCPNADCSNYCKNSSSQCRECTLRELSTGYCLQYTNNRYCPRGENCPYSHDIELFAKNKTNAPGRL